jgi:hypothetical protein
MTVDTVKTDSLSVNSHSIFAFLGGQSTRNGQKILMRIISARHGLRAYQTIGLWPPRALKSAQPPERQCEIDLCRQAFRQGPRLAIDPGRKNVPQLLAMADVTVMAV